MRSRRTLALRWRLELRAPASQSGNLSSIDCKTIPVCVETGTPRVRTDPLCHKVTRSHVALDKSCSPIPSLSFPTCKTRMGG